LPIFFAATGIRCVRKMWKRKPGTLLADHPWFNVSTRQHSKTGHLLPSQGDIILCTKDINLLRR
jgi:hypothetical protein